jgi:predicted transcriptional regulator
MTTPNKTLSRGEMLKQLREAHAATFERAQGLLREQKRIQQEILKIIHDEPKTIPEIASAVNMPAHEVLWYVASYKKYGLVVETDMSGDYPRYQRVEEQ